MRLVKILIFLLASPVYAKTPQQYCEALEAKQTNSTELLNAETTPMSVTYTAGPTSYTVSEAMTFKYCYHGNFVFTRCLCQYGGSFSCDSAMTKLKNILSNQALSGDESEPGSIFGCTGLHSP